MGSGIRAKRTRGRNSGSQRRTTHDRHSIATTHQTQVLPFAWCGARRADRTVSDALWELTRPLIDAASHDLTQTRLDNLFLVAALAWNASIDYELDQDALEERLDGIASELSHENDPDAVRETAGWLAERKQRLFPRARRRITGVEARWQGDALHVRAASRAS